MSQEQNKQVFNEWITAHQEHDIDKMINLLTDDITIQSSAGKKMPPADGKQEARIHWQTIYNIFPDFRMEALDVTAEGDKLVAEISHGGTMKGKMGDMEPTGKSYRTEGAFRFNFLNGKIKSIKTYWDVASMMEQLGLMPQPKN